MHSLRASGIQPAARGGNQGRLKILSAAGREMKDVHPLFVLSPRGFNKRTGIVIGLPMTTVTYNATIETYVSG
ncbi:MAG TPA: type II toxin-antitoxin system PemK/MazF family toxin [Steroidobacteraceae bacterium]|nr:type II toxin-antitoxin system PemK/MazF family toxin [Steroidobacteraceae bacterium]